MSGELSNTEKILSDKIKTKQAIIGVLGVGYVGEALAESANQSQFKVLGFTRDKEKAEEWNKSKDSVCELTSDFDRLSQCDVIAVCVPTPVFEDKTPDLGPISDSIERILPRLRAGQIIIVESTIATGTTRNFILPRLEAGGLRCGVDFFLAFSPERIDPGNKTHNFRNTPKPVAGVDNSSKRLAVTFYSSIVENIVPMSTLEAAEMTKLLENTFRLVNIAFANEFAEYAKARGVDAWEVIDAASTKPFGFMPHYPGPGIGGHCIPVDPFYLLQDAKLQGVEMPIVEASGNVVSQKPKKVAQKALSMLKDLNGRKKFNRVLLLGLSYKQDIEDIRESPAIEIWKEIERNGFQVSYHDPFVPKFNGSHSIELTSEVLENHDLIIITTAHSAVDYQKLNNLEVPVLDTRHVFNGNGGQNIFAI